MEYIDQFVALTSATVKADRDLNQKEIDTILMLAQSFKLDTEAVAKALETKLYQQDNPEYIARTVETDNKLVLMQCCILVALADNKLNLKEVEFLNKINNAMGLPTSTFVLAIASICQNNPNIQIEGNETK